MRLRDPLTELDGRWYLFKTFHHYSIVCTIGSHQSSSHHLTSAYITSPSCRHHPSTAFDAIHSGPSIMYRNWSGLLKAFRKLFLILLEKIETSPPLLTWLTLVCGPWLKLPVSWTWIMLIISEDLLLNFVRDLGFFSSVRDALSVFVLNIG
jgi:hypothetical protein